MRADDRTIIARRFLAREDESRGERGRQNEWAAKFIADCRDMVHEGDCSKAERPAPFTCSRCVVDEAFAEADYFIALLASFKTNESPLTMSNWKPIDTASKDVGVRVWLWCVHDLAKYCKDPVAEGYAAPVVGEWIDHNGGGWTWRGLCGVHTHWMPYREGDERPSPPTPFDQTE